MVLVMKDENGDDGGHDDKMLTGMRMCARM